MTYCDALVSARCGMPICDRMATLVLKLPGDGGMYRYDNAIAEWVSRTFGGGHLDYCSE